MITQDQIAEKLERVRWHGRYFSAICPFHDDREPSLLVFEDGSYCLGCLKGASLDSLWKRVSGEPSRGIESCSPLVHWRYILHDLATFCKEAHERIKRYPELGFSLRKRGLQERIPKSQIGWWDGWLTVPIRTQAACLAGIVLRSTAEVQKRTQVRYATPPSQPALLYTPDWKLIEDRPAVFVPFGIMDAEAIALMGFASATSTEGQRFTPSLLDSIRKPLIVISDKGEEPAGRRLAASLGWRGIPSSLDYPPQAKDPAAFLTIPHNSLSQQLAHLERKYA